MRYLSLFLIGLLLFCFLSQPVSYGTLAAPVPTGLSVTKQTAYAGPSIQEPAEEILQGVSVFINGRNLSNLLHDNDHGSKMPVQPGDEVLVESERPFRNLYIKWEDLSGTYTLVWEGGSLECGQYGIIHDYIHLPEDVSSLRIVTHAEEKQTLCDVRLFGPGTTPEDVQVWLPPCQEADILVFPTHSDDDVLFFGPLISYYAIERGLTVQTAFMVNHQYQAYRQHERLDGLWELGIRHYPILWIAPDTGTHDRNYAMSFYSPYPVEQWQVEQIRRFRPLVVVGHDPEGEYGNGGHMVNTHYLIQAVESAANPEAFPESAARYGTWDTPKLYLHLYPQHEIILDVDTPMTMDSQGRSPFLVAQDAFRYHPSQNKHGLKVQKETNPDYDCRPFGLYRTLVGYDTAADIMDHIYPALYRVQRETYLPAAIA